MTKFLGSFVLALAVIASSACHDVGAPNRLIVTNFDTTTWRGSLIVAPNTSWWQPMSATVTSTSGSVNASQVGGFRYSIDKPNMVAVDTQPTAPTTTTGGYQIEKNFLIRALAEGATKAEVATITIWPDADPRQKKHIIVTPFKP